MIPGHFIAIAIGFLLDLLIGDPKNWPHPVRWIGNFIERSTAIFNKKRFRMLKGTIVALATIGLVLAIVFVIVTFMYSVNLYVGILVEACFIAIALAQRSLRDEALQVAIPLEEGDINSAREKVSYIVGRDTESLNESEIARATIETVSENTSDGVTAPLFWAFLLGAPGIWLYKAVNTLDSMIGYKNEEYKDFGMFAARLDDVLNFIPARLTGFLLVIATANEGKISLWKRFVGWNRDARRHPSPNSGFLEAATAWQLGIQLGGKNTYKGVLSERPTIGPAYIPLTAHHIRVAVRQMQIVSFVYWFTMLAVGVYLYAFA